MAEEESQPVNEPPPPQVQAEPPQPVSTMSGMGGRSRASVVINDQVIIDLDNDDEKDYDDDLTIYWNIRRTTEKPCTCCCQLCGCWFFLIVLLIILMAAVAAIEFTLGVPFYDRSEINQRRADAYAAVEDQADYLDQFAAGGVLGLCVHEDPTVLTRNGTLLQGPMPSASCQRTSLNDLRLLYVSKDRKSNILTPENLAEIQKIEARILDHIEFSRYCYLINSTYPAFTARDPETVVQVVSENVGNDPNYAACERIHSPLNFMDEAYFDISGAESGFGYYLMAQDQFPQEYDLSQENLDTVVNYWSTFTAATYNLSEISPFLVGAVDNQIGVNNLFFTVTSGEFTVGSTEAIGLTSVINLGYQLNGYSAFSEDILDQHDDMGAYARFRIGSSQSKLCVWAYGQSHLLFVFNPQGLGCGKSLIPFSRMRASRV